MLSTGIWWGLESECLLHVVKVRFKSFGSNPRNQGKTIGSQEPAGAAVVPSEHPELGILPSSFFFRS